jgi:hypothetical protein
MGLIIKIIVMKNDDFIDNYHNYDYELIICLIVMMNMMKIVINLIISDD